MRGKQREGRERGILKYLGKKNEVNRSLPTVISHGFWTDLTTHKLWAPQSKSKPTNSFQPKPQPPPKNPNESKIQTHQQPSTKTTISAKKSKRTSSTTAQASNHHNHNKKLKPKSLDRRPKSRKYEIKKRDEPIWQRGGEREREIAQLDAVWKTSGDKAQSDNYSVGLSFA